MIVGLLEINLRIPMARSLKDRRNIIRSLSQKIQNKYNVALAEVNTDRKWKDVTLAVVTVSERKVNVEKTLNRVDEFVDQFAGVICAGVNFKYF